MESIKVNAPPRKKNKRRTLASCNGCGCKIGAQTRAVVIVRRGATLFQCWDCRVEQQPGDAVFKVQVKRPLREHEFDEKKE